MCVESVQGPWGFLGWGHPRTGLMEMKTVETCSCETAGFVCVIIFSRRDNRCREFDKG